jgi:two-component system response regulator YesN
MIKVIVVDDEKLVRSGLISMMPWSKFDIKVVGEAANGQKALDLMGTMDVDMLITDLVMPVMSGFDLIKAVRERYPQTAFVVMTCHEDFAYAKEAIRLGALDYIVKNDLETEVMDDVLARVVSKFNDFSKKETTRTTIASDVGSLIYYPNSVEMPAEEMNDFFTQYKSYGIDKNFYYLPLDIRSEEALHKTLLSKSDVVLVRIFKLPEKPFSQILKLVSIYKENGFFYDNQSEQRFFEINAETIQTTPDSIIETIQKRWLSFSWIYLKSEYDSLKQEITEKRPNPSQLKTTFHQFMLEIGHLFISIETASRWLSEISDIPSWYRFEKHLDGLRATLRGGALDESYSEEIVNGIVSAIQYMHKHTDYDFTQQKLADIANMSRSYFSIHFKLITGKSFTEYIRDLRLVKAKKLLLQSNKPIYWVAEQTGFKDERYFSRLFFQYVGLHPTEYRKQTRE